MLPVIAPTHIASHNVPVNHSSRLIHHNIRHQPASCHQRHWLDIDSRSRALVPSERHVLAKRRKKCLIADILLVICRAGRYNTAQARQSKVVEFEGTVALVVRVGARHRCHMRLVWLRFVDDQQAQDHCAVGVHKGGRGLLTSQTRAVCWNSSEGRDIATESDISLLQVRQVGKFIGKIDSIQLWRQQKQEPSKGLCGNAESVAI